MSNKIDYFRFLDGNKMLANNQGQLVRKQAGLFS